jgi:3-dehydroquinate synthase
METRIRVDLGERAYHIHLGAGVLRTIGTRCAAFPEARAALVVSDQNTAPYYLEPCLEALRSAGLRVESEVLPPGEGTKSEPYLFQLYRRAMAAGLDRAGLFVALGGGVIGDLVGFAAATYLRGVRYVQAPTTLLAMVDSSVGGKTAIDLPEGKNLVGAFHQPAAVIADIETLRTLPERELAAGLAEVVKYGVIRDETLFEQLERDFPSVAGASADQWIEIIARCCRIKAEVVRTDERESGQRAILNFGHTLGHAVETLSAGNGLRHGEAIAIGMVYAARLSERQCGWPSAHTERLVALLRRFGLPTEPPAGLSWPEVRRIMAVDKKSSGGAVRFVLGERIGRVAAGCAVDDARLEEVWRYGRSE